LCSCSIGESDSKSRTKFFKEGREMSQGSTNSARGTRVRYFNGIKFKTKRFWGAGEDFNLMLAISRKDTEQTSIGKVRRAERDSALMKGSL
jgi:hypothetical protein